MKDINKLIGSNIKRRRLEVGATQKMLGEVSGKSTTMISMIESGKRGIDVYSLHKICIALDTSIESMVSSANKVNCDICKDTTFMLCNGKNMRCVFCEE